MALEYVLGNFASGVITGRGLSTYRGTDKVERSVKGQTIELELGINELNATAQNDPDTYFKTGARFIALLDTAATGQAGVKAAGFINKKDFKVGSGYVRLQCVGLEEYIRSLLVINDGGQIITDPTAKVTFSGATWAEVMGSVVRAAFNRTDLPQGHPRPPAVLGTTPTQTGTTLKYDVVYSDAKSYGEVLDEISEFSGEGLEYMFVPRLSTDGTKVVWDFETGTPLINLGPTLDIELSGNTTHKISSFASTIDSRDIYNKLYIQTKPGEETSGADLQGKYLNIDPEIPLLESFFGPNVELTQAQIDAQATARLNSSLQAGMVVAFSIEEAWNKDEWIGYLGRKIHFTGVPNTISAGENREVRAVALSFSVQKSTITVDFMPIQPTYPKLPRQKKKDSALGEKNPTRTPLPKPPSTGGGGGETYSYTATQVGPDTINVSTTNSLVTHAGFVGGPGEGIDAGYYEMSGTVTKSLSWKSPFGNFTDEYIDVTFAANVGTTSPTEYSTKRVIIQSLPGGPGEIEDKNPYVPPWTNDGEYGEQSLWGDEGRKPGSGNPLNDIIDPVFINFKETVDEYTVWDGRYPIHHDTICQNEGNRIYGLDRLAQAVGTVYNNGTPTHYSGGLDINTGQPLQGWQPFYIKKSYLANGELGPIETIGQITPDQIKSMLSEWFPIEGKPLEFDTANSNFERSIGVSNWTIGARYYFALADSWRRKQDASAFGNGRYGFPTTPYAVNSKVSIISIALDPNTGLLQGEWRDEITPPNFGLPVTRFVSKIGKYAAFTQFVSVEGRYQTNESLEQWDITATGAMGSNDGYRPAYSAFNLIFGDSVEWSNKDTGAGNTQLIGMNSNTGKNYESIGSLIKDFSTVEAPYTPIMGVGTNRNKYTHSGWEDSNYKIMFGHFYPFSSNGWLAGTLPGLAEQWTENFGSAPLQPVQVNYGKTAESGGMKSDVLFRPPLTLIPADAAPGGQNPGGVPVNGYGYVDAEDGAYLFSVNKFGINYKKKITEAPYNKLGWRRPNEAHAEAGISFGSHDTSTGGRNFSSRYFSYDKRIHIIRVENGTIKCRSMEIAENATPTPTA